MRCSEQRSGCDYPLDCETYGCQRTQGGRIHRKVERLAESIAALNDASFALMASVHEAVGSDCLTVNAAKALWVERHEAGHDTLRKVLRETKP